MENNGITGAENSFISVKLKMKMSLDWKFGVVRILTGIENPRTRLPPPNWSMDRARFM